LDFTAPGWDFTAAKAAVVSTATEHGHKHNNHDDERSRTGVDDLLGLLWRDGLAGNRDAGHGVPERGACHSLGIA
jgi:hypothetical protein